MYDFPASPTPGQEYTPPVGGQTYVWQSPRWLVKGVPPVGGSGGGIPEAPIDSQQYARQDADWTVVEPGVSDWADITGKPVTFPPTLPIAQSGVTNLVTDLAAKAPLDSPALTGIPTAPTAAATTNTTQVATTAYVRSATLVKTGDSMSGALNITHSGSVSQASLRFGGTNTGYIGTATTLSTTVSGALKSTLDASAFTLTVPVVLPGNPTNPLEAAPKSYVDLRAPLASPVFTGNPTAPTPSVDDNDTTLATTEFVKAQGYAPLASPALTGNPTAPTPATNDNDTSIATTAFVRANLATIVSGAVVSDTAPATPQSGQLWFQSSSGRTFVWYVDANSSQWVQVAPGPAAAPAVGGASKIKETSFLSDGTWVPDPKMLFTRFFLVGGGGGGGGAQAYAANNFSVGGGGSSGQHRDAFRDRTTILAAGSSFTVTVGAGGSGGVGGMGGQGSASSISPTISGLFAANGGPGGGCYSSSGANAPVYSPGGSGSYGSPGFPGLVLFGPTPFVGWGGNGGQSVLGWGYGSGSGNSDGGTASANSGSGGGGGITWVYTTVKNGGNGGKGVVYITEFLSE